MHYFIAFNFEGVNGFKVNSLSFWYKGNLNFSRFLLFVLLGLFGSLPVVICSYLANSTIGDFCFDVRRRFGRDNKFVGDFKF